MNTEYGPDGGFAFFSGENVIASGGNIRLDNIKKLKRRNQGVNSIPVFNEMAKIVKDEFWSPLLIEASRGYLPKRYKFINNQLVYKYHSTTGSLDLVLPEKYDRKKIFSLFEELKDFLKTFTGIQAPEPETSLASIADLGEAKDLPWSKIKMSPPKLNAAIGSYVSKIKQDHNLSAADFEILFGAVKSMVIANIFYKTAFHYSKGILSKIEGLEYDPKQKIFTLDPKKITHPKEVRFCNEKYENDETCTNFSASGYERTPQKISYLHVWESYLEGWK